MAAAWTRAALAAVLAGTAVAQTAPVVAQTTPVVARDAWIRAVPAADVAAAYLTLQNVGSHAVTVTGVRSPAATHAMIHETVVENGLARMRPHEQVVIPAGQTIKLEPGGLHVMLHGLTRPLAVGQTVPLLLTLSNGNTLQVTASVRPLNAG